MKELFKNQEFKALILTLNKFDQLYDQGIDATGTPLSQIGGSYSPYTIMLKEQKGQPTDRVTLNDTGDFYKSFRLFLKKTEIEITADPMKDGTNLLEQWGKDVLGLTPGSLQILREKAKEILIPVIKNTILKTRQTRQAA